MKRSHLILGAICIMLAAADATLALALRTSTPVPASATAAPLADGFDYFWVDLDPYIAHAGGGILGHTYTNSYEALLLNYQLGHRLFEFDISLANDNAVILAHDPAAKNAAAFNSTLINDQFHPLSLQQLIDFLYQHPDIYVITDTKYTDEATTRALLGELRSTAQALDSDLLDRFIIQIYHPDMLPWVMDVYPWKSIIYTLYQDPNWTPENVLAFAKATGVKYITAFDGVVTPEILDLWQSNGLLVGVHTVNDLEAALRFQSLGVTNIYTDYLLP